jgi:hypothetical protein
MELRLPELMTRPLMVLLDVAAVIAPDADMVVIPLRAPAVLTFRPDDVRPKVPVALPMLVLAVPVVLMLVVPVMVAPPLRVDSPVTPRVPPRVVAPVPTVRVLVPLIDVAPLRVTLPVPVEKVPLPLWAKLPLL